MNNLSVINIYAVYLLLSAHSNCKYLINSERIGISAKVVGKNAVHIQGWTVAVHPQGIGSSLTGGVERYRTDSAGKFDSVGHDWWRHPKWTASLLGQRIMAGSVGREDGRPGGEL